MTALDLLLRRGLMFADSNKHIDPSKPGEPEIETDPETGEVTAYENTGEVEVTEAGTSVDTEFVPFDGKDWELHIYAHFAASEQTEEYPTLLCCMSSTSPWPGITIRYEDTQLYCIFNDGDGNKHYYTLSADSDGNVNITITYVSDIANATNNGTQFMTNVSMSNMDLEELTLQLLADYNSTTGELRRYGVGTIYEFYIKKLE